MITRLIGKARLSALYTLAAVAIMPVGCGGMITQPAPGEDPVIGEQLGQPAGPSATNTTSSFGIPSGLTGSVDAGQQIFSNICSNCHNSLSPHSYDQIQSALAGVRAMQSLNLTDQQVADVTAYLNRASIPSPDPTPPPSTEPTPPPADNPPTTGPGSGDDDGDDAFDDDSGDEEGDDAIDGGEADDDSGGDSIDDGEADDDSGDDSIGDDQNEDESGDDSMSGDDDESDDAVGDDSGSGESEDGESGEDEHGEEDD